MQKPPLAPKPKLIQPQWPRFSPTATRKNAHAQPSPGTPERVKPALAPKPCLPKLSTAVESKPLSSKSHHQRSLSANTGMPRSVGLLNSKNGSQQENKKPDWDYVIPICLCSQENCQCVGSVAEDSRSHLARPGGKLESRGEEVEGNKHRVNSTALLPGVCLQPANAGTARPSLPHRTRSEANGDFVPLSGAGQRPGKHPPVPVPRKPRKAALARQEKVEDDREERAGSAGRETNVREVMVSAEGKSGPSLSVSVAGPAQNTPVRGEQQPPSLSVRNACPPPAPPPRKKPFLSAPERLAPAPGAPPQDVDEEDLDWGDGIYEMECSVDEGVEEVGVEKEVEARRGEPESQHGALTRLPSHSGPLDRRERSPHVACTATNSSQLAGGKGGKVPPRKPQRPGAPMSWIWKKEPSEETEEGKCPPNGKKPHLEDPPTGRATRELNPPPREKQSRSLMPALGSPGAPKPLQSSLGKQKSKSFSAADLARTEGQKRNSIQKLLDLKLSVKLLPKLNVKGGQTRGGCGHSAPAAERVQCVDGDQDRAQEIQRLERLVGRKFSCPQVGVEQSVDGDEFCSAEYENIPYYEEIPDYVNVAVGKTVDPQQAQNPPPVPLAPTLGWQHTMHDEEGDIYEAYAPPENALGQQQMLSSSERSSFEEEEEEDAYVDEGHSDDQDVTMDQSSDEEEDGGSSASSRGDTDPQGGAENERSVKKSKIHHIATEIMSSEKVFVNVLKLLHIDFRDAVSKATAQTGKPVIEERHLNQILYYLPQLYELNKDLLRELEQRVEKWDENARLADIFVKKGPYLKMYSTYIREFDKNVALLDEQSKKNPAFGGVVREFQAEPRCANLALRHYLLKPVQRIPQYQLLLTDYLKHLPPDSTDYTDTQAALGIVKEVANHANDIMKQGDNFQKLIQVQCSLNGHHEIVQPGRVFLKEGILKKLSRKIMQPRMFFLFNDTLLYTTPVQSGQFKLNNMLSLSGMKVSKPTHEAHQNELNIESVERSFILSASSATERDEWLEAIAMAISDYTRKKITFISSKTQEEMKDGAKAGGGPLGSKAPIWIPDPRATMCMICTCEFSLTWRRHHCRACGKVVCQSCSSNKHYLEYLKNQLARVCDQCFLVLQQQKCEQALSPTQAPGGRPAFTFSRKHKKIPAALKEVSASTDNYSMSGYLQRSKGNKKQVKRLWFVIKDKVLYTYAASEDVAALASQPLLGFVLKEDSSQKHEFKLFHKNTLFYIFRADDVQSAQRWIDSFKEATVL